jgi:hypothetical protein
MIVFRVIGMIFSVLMLTVCIVVGGGGAVFDRAVRNSLPSASQSAPSGETRDRYRQLSRAIEDSMREDEVERDRLEHGGARFQAGKPMISSGQLNHDYD